MHIPYSTYFFVIAFPVLIFAVIIMAGLFLAVCRMIILKKKEEFKNLICLALMLAFLCLAARDRLLPTARLILDFGAQHSYTEERVNSKRFDQSYNHGKDSGWFIHTDSGQFYILEDQPIAQGETIRIEYLPRSRMIVSWEYVGKNKQ